MKHLKLNTHPHLIPTFADIVILAAMIVTVVALGVGLFYAAGWALIHTGLLDACVRLLSLS